MTDEAVDDREFSQASALRDGTPVTIRALHANDRERIITAFDHLEPESIYTRFFSFVKEIPAKALDLVAAVDFDKVGALVVTIGSGSAETIIAGVSYVVCAQGPDGKSAEVAFTVEEDYQGQGLASKLLALLTPIARRHGITQFEADVLAGNGPMLSVFQRSGLPAHKRSEGGVVHVTLDLRPRAG